MTKRILNVKLDEWILGNFYQNWERLILQLLSYLFVKTQDWLFDPIQKIQRRLFNALYLLMLCHFFK